MCVYSSVRGTLTLPHHSRGRILPLGYHFFLQTVECCSHGNNNNKKQHWKKLIFVIYLWSMSTSHLYAHLFIDMCTMDWMLNALKEEWSQGSEMSQTCFHSSVCWHDLQHPCSLCGSLMSCSSYASCLASLASFQPSLKCRDSFLHVSITQSPDTTSSQRLCSDPHCKGEESLSGPCSVSEVSSVYLSFALWRMHYYWDMLQSWHQVQSVWFDLEIWRGRRRRNASYPVFLALPFKKKGNEVRLVFDLIWNTIKKRLKRGKKKNVSPFVLTGGRKQACSDCVPVLLNCPPTVSGS